MLRKKIEHSFIEHSTVGLSAGLKFSKELGNSDGIQQAKGLNAKRK